MKWLKSFSLAHKQTCLLALIVSEGFGTACVWSGRKMLCLFSRMFVLWSVTLFGPRSWIIDDFVLLISFVSYIFYCTVLWGCPTDSSPATCWSRCSVYLCCDVFFRSRCQLNRDPNKEQRFGSFYFAAEHKALPADTIILSCCFIVADSRW